MRDTRLPGRGRLPGHTLANEGRIYEIYEGGIYRVNVGSTRCSCGEESPVLPSDNARRVWHRDVHKAGLAAREALADTKENQR